MRTRGGMPDHLAVVLEFAATVDARAGAALLAEHGVAIRMVWAALTETGSPYADVLAAVCATLPPANGRGSRKGRGGSRGRDRPRRRLGWSRSR